MPDYLGGIGRKIYGQSSNGGSNNQLLPRSRFNFQVTINYINGNLVLERISEVQMPGHIFRTSVLNQYNRKRIIQTGVDYTPIYINAYDTRDAELEKFLKEYSEYYFKGPMTTDGKVELNYSDIISEFASGNSDKGYNLVSNKNFIRDITIKRINSKSDTNTVKIYAPVITGIAGDTLNYSDSNPAQIRIEIAYEGYSIESS